MVSSVVWLDQSAALMLPNATMGNVGRRGMPQALDQATATRLKMPRQCRQETSQQLDEMAMGMRRARDHVDLRPRRALPLQGHQYRYYHRQYLVFDNSRIVRLAAVLFVQRTFVRAERRALAHVFLPRRRDDASARPEQQH